MLFTFRQSPRPEIVCHTPVAQEGASVLPEALEVLQELCQAVHVCIVAHVLSDIGEAVIKGSLEAQGLLGSGPRQLRPHRVLCCR